MKPVRHGDVVVTLPDGWRDQTVATFIGRESDEGSPVVTVSEFSGVVEKTSAGFARAQLPAISQSIGPEIFELIAEGPLLFNGIEAYRLVYEFAPSLQQPMVRQTQVFVVRNSKGHIVTAVHERGAFLDIEAEINQLIESIRFEET